MGEAYWALKDRESAAKEFTDTTKIAPKLANPYYYLGVTCQGEGKKELALELFDRFRSLAPEGPFSLDARKREDVLRAKK